MLTLEEVKKRQRERVKAWRDRNPEKVKAARQRYKERHPDKMAEQSTKARKWQVEHPEAVKNHNSAHYQKYRGKYLEKRKTNYKYTPKPKLSEADKKLKQREYNRAYGCLRRNNDAEPLNKWHEKWGKRSKP